MIKIVLNIYYLAAIRRTERIVLCSNFLTNLHSIQQHYSKFNYNKYEDKWHCVKKFIGKNGYIFVYYNISCLSILHIINRYLDMYVGLHLRSTCKPRVRLHELVRRKHYCASYINLVNVWRMLIIFAYSTSSKQYLLRVYQHSKKFLLCNSFFNLYIWCYKIGK